MTNQWCCLPCSQEKAKQDKAGKRKSAGNASKGRLAKVGWRKTAGTGLTGVAPLAAGAAWRMPFLLLSSSAANRIGRARLAAGEGRKLWCAES